MKQHPLIIHIELFNDLCGSISFKNKALFMVSNIFFEKSFCIEQKKLFIIGNKLNTGNMTYQLIGELIYDRSQ